MKNLLLESKQSIVNLGLPEVIASLISEKFGKFAPAIAKWYRDYAIHGKSDLTNWWLHAYRKNIRGDIDLLDAIKIYNAAIISEEAYAKALEFAGISFDNGYDRAEVMQDWREIIKEGLFAELFFRRPLIKAISNKEIKDLAPFKGLAFEQAQNKYEEKKIFSDAEPVKSYENGWRWINVGQSCDLAGRLMKNCGNVGVMGKDPDRTMLMLFDPANIPHVVVLYSPNETRISGEEGQRYSSVKAEYTDYVLDITKTLGATFDYHGSKSKLLKIKAKVGSFLVDAKKVPGANESFEYYLLSTTNGNSYYTDGYNAIKSEDAASLGLNNSIEPEQQTRFLTDNIFNHYERQRIQSERPEIKFPSLEDLPHLATVSEVVFRVVKKLLSSQ
jgi:hypothetical protein